MQYILLPALLVLGVVNYFSAFDSLLEWYESELVNCFSGIGRACSLFFRALGVEYGSVDSDVCPHSVLKVKITRFTGL